MEENMSAVSQDNIYFGKEVINRVSFLREDNEFVTLSVLHPSTRFIFFENSNPLVDKESEGKLVILSNGDNQVSDKGGVSKGLFSAGDEWQQVLSAWSEDNKNQDMSLRETGKPVFVFLGIEDESVGLDLTHLKSLESSEEKYLDYQGRYQGIPYYAVDLSGCGLVRDLVVDHILKNTSVDPSKLFFTYSRNHFFDLGEVNASLYSHAKMFVEWISRNRFCPGCGHAVIPVHAGGKLKCTNDTVAEKRSEEDVTYKCPVRNAKLSNASFPRTDAVVIAAVASTDCTKVLLSLSRRYAQLKMYACTAGFMEPSETVETAVRRELWEETGVSCSSVELKMTQPWPFPGNLMIGCVAYVDFNGSNEVVHLGHDKELADARWFDVEFLRGLIYDFDNTPNPDSLIIPQDVSVAYQLIKLVVDAAPSANSNSSENPSNKL